jgi:hypothetical protein
MEIVLIEVERLVRLPRGTVLAQIKTPIGHTAVPWCGDPDALPGQYDVEWTVDEEISWGGNAKPGNAPPAVRQGGHCVVLRGRIDLTVDGAAILDLGGSQILLDLSSPIPADVSGTWVELYLRRENIALCPYEL